MAPTATSLPDSSTTTRRTSATPTTRSTPSPQSWPTRPTPPAAPSSSSSSCMQMLPLADGLAMRYSGRGVETDDLLQVARTALVKAVNRYRPGAGPGFAAFAHPTISGELKRWFRDHGWAVRPPRRIQELRAGLVVEEERLRHALNREPARRRARPRPRRHRRRGRRGPRGAPPATTPCRSTPPPPPAPTWPTSCSSPSSHAGTIEMRDALRAAVARLTERQRLVLRAALRRRAHPGRDRRADRRQPDAGLAHPARHRSSGCGASCSPTRSSPTTPAGRDRWLRRVIRRARSGRHGSSSPISRARMTACLRLTTSSFA